MIPKLNKIEVFDTISKSTNVGKRLFDNNHKKVIASKIMSEYFRQMYTALYEGKQVDIIGLGCICLRCEPKKQRIMRYNHEEKKMKEMINLKMPGMVASFKFDGTGMIKKGIRFKATILRRRELNLILQKTDFAKIIEQWP